MSAPSCGVISRSLFEPAERAPVAVAACTPVPRHLVVLASSSSGNCSALIHGEGGTRRVTLIDAGLSPRRTNRLLAGLGLSLDHVDDVLFTHLDTDHCHPGWVSGLPRHATVRVHQRHVKRGMRSNLLVRRTEVFVGGFTLPAGARVEPVLLSHDDLGAAAFRVEFETERGVESLGYATDLGHVPAGLVELFRGVDVLAIESNYCPVMQENSDRPDFLKRRIMDGSGHLSNQQSAAAVRAIAPRRHVVLLHLSRQCNTPELAAAGHAGATYELTVAHHEVPTGLVRVA
jgi:phosphoribosyl 1,2-cyclic phosphodiesterase